MVPEDVRQNTSPACSAFHELTDGPDLQVVNIVTARAAIDADHALHLTPLSSERDRSGFSQDAVPALGALDLDRNHPRQTARPATCGFDDKIHLDTGGRPVIGEPTVLAADLVVDTQLVVNQGFKRSALPAPVGGIPQQTGRSPGDTRVEPVEFRLRGSRTLSPGRQAGRM